MKNLKEEKELTQEDKDLYEWIECTTFEEFARGERWFIRGVCKAGFEIVLLSQADNKP